MLTIAISRSSFTFTPSSFRNAWSFGVLRGRIEQKQNAPLLVPEIPQHFISRSDKSYCGPAMNSVLMSGGIVANYRKDSSR